MIVRLPIDIKSLYLNIKNDNQSGHTATVATPLRQYGSYHEDLLSIFDIPENINATSREDLVGSILSNSRAEAKIVRVCVFDNISVNGITLDECPSFCMYIREETAPTNVHCGRQKIHYPMSFQYSDSEVEISNKQVMKSVSDALHNYAFIIEAFEYDVESAKLNFDAIIVGANGIPYSKVFINRRGVGNKFSSSFSEDADLYDSEIIALREKLGFDNVTPDNYPEVMQANKAIAIEMARESIRAKGGKRIRNLFEEYPYTLYDLEYWENGVKCYAIVRCTATTQRYFHLPFNKIRFCNDFSSMVRVILVCDVNDNPRTHTYTISELNNMNKSIVSLSYEDTGEKI